MEIRAGRRTTWAGCSAGALCAALAQCQVDTEMRVRAAFDLGEKAGLFKRAGGGFGVVGKLIRSWLQDVLPDDAAESCDGLLSVQVTLRRPFRRCEVRRVDRFANKTALIDALMCSVPIPFFLDSKMWATLELDGRRYGDVTVALRVICRLACRITKLTSSMRKVVALILS